MSLIILIAILCFVLRALPAVLKITPQGQDQYYHLFYGDFIRNNKFRYPYKPEQFLLPGVYDYPPLYHYVLALFPRSLRERFGLYLGAIIDTLNVIVIYYFIIYLSALPDIAIYISNPGTLASIACLLFTISPALLAVGAGPRAYSATPRPLGELFFSLTFLFGLVFFVESNIYALISASFFASLILLSSKFGAQVLLFFSLLVAVLTNCYLLLLIPVLGTGIGLIISKGYLARVLYGSLRHSLLYKNVMQDSCTFTRARNDLSPIADCIRNGLRGDLKEFAKSFYTILNHNTYVILLIRNPLLLLLICIMYIKFDDLMSNTVLYFLTCWIAASVVVFIITSLRPFLFLGEAERYLEYSLSAQVILLVFFFDLWAVYLPLVIVYCFLFYVATIIELKFMSDHIDTSIEENLFSWIKNNLKDRKFLGIPAGGIQHELLYKTGNCIWQVPANLSRVSEADYLQLYPIRYPYPSDSLNDIVNQYDIHYLLVNEQDVKETLLSGIHYDFTRFKKIFGNSKYSIYKTTKSSETRTTELMYR